MSDPYRGHKNAFSRYTTGVTVVSCLPDGHEPLGITVNSFTSVSLEPTLVLWCLDRRSSVFGHFMSADNYAVSILNAAQQPLSIRFATPGRHNFLPDETESFATGAPLLKDRLAGFDCRIWDRKDAGDHVILIGEVVHHDYSDDEPLIYSGRQYLQGRPIGSN
ncbi:flavin reductase family protein [Parvularcula sp. LCG005]|uniref:flavin reductase family protein n=1 Tax=Parvularcula sp. LCG005 TaxID=3078805 RepID=UPI002942FB1E|nr:flavin reductase family protein [Parvularcula sp. LCG005]WOI52378.1 flavin reductase family protein [Parvularcula sp. LCG005]